MELTSSSPRAALVASVALLVGLSACETSDADRTAAVAPRGLAVSLSVRYSDGAGRHLDGVLHCRDGGLRATGFLRPRDPRRLCRFARRLGAWLAGPPRQTKACTEIWGGPDRARVRGTVGRAGIDRAFDRQNGCGIADWEKAQSLLPHPSGVG